MYYPQSVTLTTNLSSLIVRLIFTCTFTHTPTYSTMFTKWPQRHVAHVLKASAGIFTAAVVQFLISQGLYENHCLVWGLHQGTIGSAYFLCLSFSTHGPLCKQLEKFPINSVPFKACPWTRWCVGLVHALVQCPWMVNKVFCFVFPQRMPLSLPVSLPLKSKQEVNRKEGRKQTHRPRSLHTWL